MLLPSFRTQSHINTLQAASLAGTRSVGHVVSQALTEDPVGSVFVANITVGREPAGVAYDSSNGYVYFTNHLSNSTSVISGSTVVATIPVGIGPGAVSYDSRNQYVYVANSIFNISNSVSIISGTTVLTTIPMVYAPDGLAYDNSNGYVYVSTTKPSYYANPVNVIEVVNGTKVIANITAGSAQDSFVQGIAYDERNGYVYVADWEEDRVTVINGTTVMANVSVGSAPTGMGYDSGNGYIYVPAYSPPYGASIAVIKDTTLVATISGRDVPPGGTGVAYASNNGYVYVANSGVCDLCFAAQSSLTVISNTTIVDTIWGGIVPWQAFLGVAYDSENRDIYVANPSQNTTNAGTVRVISTNAHDLLLGLEPTIFYTIAVVIAVASIMIFVIGNLAVKRGRWGRATTHVQ